MMKTEFTNMNIDKLSGDQLAGQRLMIGFDGTFLNDELKFYIDTLKVGGIILFLRNISSPEQLGKLCNSAQNWALSCGQPPLFISIDQEGGAVARLKEPFTQFPGNPSMQGIRDAVEFAQITARELHQIGINMNMAPVMDVAPEKFNSIMSNRVFGSDPQWVSLLGGTVIDHLQRGIIMAVAKHFPGIGRTTLDSHLDLPTSDITLEDLENYDIWPFRTAIEKNVAGIMLSHIKYEKIDKNWPASLSRIIAKDILRENLGYRGLVITDDLDMGAIANYYDIETVIDRIYDADIDIALICHPGPKIPKAFRVFQSKLNGKNLFPKKFKDSVERILKTKYQFLSNTNRTAHRPGIDICIS